MKRRKGLEKEDRGIAEVRGGLRGVRGGERGRVYFPLGCKLQSQTLGGVTHSIMGTVGHAGVIVSFPVEPISSRVDMSVSVCVCLLNP